MKQVEKDFFGRDSVIVARELVGKILQVGDCCVRIVETEAYRQDKASHAYTRTQRSGIMYETYGHVYVYFIYGMYFCVNITTEREGKPGAVLIRAGEPLSGIAKMKERRGVEKVENLCSGPGKLCMALGITKEQNGLELGEEISVWDDGFVADVGRSRRMGIKEDRHLLWRFFVKLVSYFLLSQSTKLAIPKENGLKKWIFDINIVMPLKIITILRINMGYVVLFHRRHKQTIPKMMIRSLMQFNRLL